MNHKKLSLKKGKGGKLKIHKNDTPEETEAEEPPFDPDPVEEPLELSGAKHPTKNKAVVNAPEGSTYYQSNADGEIVGRYISEGGSWVVIGADGETVGRYIFEGGRWVKDEGDPEDLVEEGMAGKIGKGVTAKTEVKGETVYKETEDEIEPPSFPQGEHTATIGMNLSRTINMGQFESLKMSVFISVPSQVDEDEIEGNYQFCKDWCEEKLNELSEEYTE